MKNQTLWWGVGIIAGAVAVAAVFVFEEPTQPKFDRELIYGSWVSPKHGVNVDALPPMFRGVLKDTKGAVKWKLVAGGQLVKGKNTLSGIKDGVVDAGLTIAVYTPKNLPATSTIFSKLIWGNDTVAATGAYMETFFQDCPECIAEHKKNNAVFLSGYGTTPFKMMCRKKVQTIADLKGKKIRSAGGGTTLVKTIGGVPVGMSPAQATTALQRGALDCVLGAVAWLKSYGYQDVAKHIIDYPLGIVGPPGSFTINRDVWNKFTTAQKKIHVKYLPGVVAHSAISAYVNRDAAILANAKANGVTLYKGGAEFDALTAKFEPIQIARIIKNGKKWGLKDPAKILAALDRNFAKWSKLSKEIDNSVAKFSELLWREVYSKIDVDKI